MNAVYLIIGGSLGTLARYYATGWAGSTRGLGVFVVNIVGAFVIGLFLTLSEDRFLWPPQLRLLVATGFLGAFTTFSTYVLAVVQLVDAGAWVTGVGYAASSVAAGLAAAWFGLRLGRSLVARVGRPRPVSGWSSDAPGG